MAEASSIRARMDVLDFVINFLIEHEKKMDMMISRLEKLEAGYVKQIANCKKCCNLQVIENASIFEKLYEMEQEDQQKGETVSS